MFLEVGRKATKLMKKQFLTQKMVKKMFCMGQKIPTWTVNWKKVFFNDETHLFVQGYKLNVVRQSESETLQLDHIL